jgi:hypothetical protein
LSLDEIAGVALVLGGALGDRAKKLGLGLGLASADSNLRLGASATSSG